MARRRLLPEEIRRVPCKNAGRCGDDPLAERRIQSEFRAENRVEGEYPIDQLRCDARAAAGPDPDTIRPGHPQQRNAVDNRD